MPDPSTGFGKVETLYAFVWAGGEDEGIMYDILPTPENVPMLFPFLAGDLERLASLYTRAEVRSKDRGATYKLVKFSNIEDVTDIMMPEVKKMYQQMVDAGKLDSEESLRRQAEEMHNAEEQAQGGVPDDHFPDED